MSTPNLPLPSHDGAPLLRRLPFLVWDKLSLYIPALLMLLLALASFLLLQATPEPVVPPAPRAISSEPDNFMQGFSVRNFNADGSLRSEVFGTEARHHPDTGNTVIDQARIRAFNDRRQLTTATAQQITANAAGDVFILEKDAVVVRQAGRADDGSVIPRMEFHGDYLRVTLKPDHLSSDRPVLLIRGQDQLVSQRLDFDGDQRVADMEGAVRVQFAPRP